MTARHHFVVVGEVDADGRVSFCVDHDTAEAVFPEGAVWDDEQGEFIRPMGATEVSDVLILQRLDAILRGN